MLIDELIRNVCGVISWFKDEIKEISFIGFETLINAFN